jgi:hypothetical protein
MRSVRLIMQCRPLASDQPLGLALTRQLLEMLAGSPDWDVILAVAQAQLDLSRLLVGAAGESADSLRDLSIP